MKLNLIGIDEKTINDLLQLKRVIDFEIDVKGEKVNIHKLDEDEKIDIEISKGIIKYKCKNHLFRALSIYIQNSTNTEFNIKEIQQIKYIGPMIDVSRNAVYKIDKLKDIMVNMAILGFNEMMLYTEDTYEISEYPYFGYLRGKYSKEELKEITNYGEILGIEVIPCIQTLAHLKQTLKWDYAKDIKDTDDVLIVGEDKTYEFIECMIRNLRDCFKSNKIHIGMDEAFGLGRGKYLDKNGYKNHYSIMTKHLDKVCEICKKYNFKPMMWDDMFFRIGSPNGTYYNLDTVIEKEIINSIPKDLSLVYWDYYHNDKESYEKLIDIRSELNNEIIFAGGIWKWTGLVPCYDKTFKTTNEAISVCKEKNIKRVIATIWGDDSDETPIDTIIPGLILFSEHAYSNNVNMKDISDKCNFLTKLNLEDFFIIQDLDKIEEGDSENLRTVNPSKYLLYQDILLGAFDAHIEDLIELKGIEFIENYYMDLSEKLINKARDNDKFYKLYKLYANLARVLSIKSIIGVKIRKTYLERNILKLKEICDVDLKELINRIDNLQESYRKIWYKERKGQGFEVIDIRLGGVRSRVISTIYRLESYINNDIQVIEELEEDRLIYNKLFNENSKQVSFNRYKDIVTQNILSW